MLRLTLTFCFLIFTSVAAADFIDYGDYVGDDVMFLNVTEDTREAGDMSDFGAPTVVGNTLDFDPTDFDSSVNNSGSHINDAQLNFTLMANQNASIDTVTLEEGGDYTLIGLGSALAQASYGAAVFWDIIEIDGQTVSGLSGSGSFSDSFELPDDEGTAVVWEDSITFDFNAILASLSLSGSVTKVEFAIDNTLATAAADGGSAFIAKKDVGLNIVVNQIPEPSVAGILVASLALAGLRRRK
ncbi:MAG: PEP-CTERM sorting domain-containing protein [Planctomycetota bacterium]